MDCLGVRISSVFATCALAISSQGVLGDISPLPSIDWTLATPIDSGVIRLHEGIDQDVWTTTISVPDARWIRLKFSQIALGQHPDGSSSQLFITSAMTGETQVLDAVSAQQWHETSAYFNGDTVELTLIAAANGRANRIRVEEVIVDDPALRVAATICGSTDDRLPSNDPRNARVIPIGCTGWIIDDFNRCFMTAGHCMGGNDVVEFNVPLSTSTGGLVHPGPEDQYSVDPVSKQSTNGGVGNDWGYFGVFPNSNTGLTPVQAQGDFYEVVSPADADLITTRITGYGTTGSGVPSEWNQAQKTHTGPFDSWTGNTLAYKADTTGGNSGSPVVDETTGKAIGIHSHGGCTSSGGTNKGTSAAHPDLLNALASPQGICAGGIGFELIGGLPEFLEPGEGAEIALQLTVTPSVTVKSGSVIMHYDSGSGEQEVIMFEEGGLLYSAQLPGGSCGENTMVYFSAESTDGFEFTFPDSAPTSQLSLFTATAVHEIFADDFEVDHGWTVQSTDLISGAWERGVPIGGGDRNDPIDDFDGSGSCYLTENVDGDSDVDGGPTVLTSPLFDVATVGGVLSYARWHQSDNDVLSVEISNDAGSNWQNLETVSSSNVWTVSTFDIGSVISPTDEMQVRFSVADNPNNAVTESGVDRFSVVRPSCLTQLCQTDLGFGGPGTATLSLCGDELVSGGVSFLRIEGLPPGALVYLVVSTSNNPSPLLEGTLVPSAAEWVLTYVADEDGVVEDMAKGGNNQVLYAQAGYEDDSQPSGYGFTNAIEVEVLP